MKFAGPLIVQLALSWTFISVLLCISISQGLLQGILLIRNGFKYHRERFTAGIIVLLVSLTGTHFLLGPTGLIHLLPHLSGIIFPLILLLGPLLYMLMQLNLHPKETYQFFPHSLAAIGCFIVLIPYYILPSAEKIQIALNYNSGQNSVLGTILFWISLIHLSSYISAALIKLLGRKDKKKTKSLIVIYSVFLLLTLIEMGINLFSYFHTLPAPFMDNVDILFISILLYSIGFRSFLLDDRKKSIPYTNKSFTSFEKDELEQVVQTLLDSQFYLDPEMNLEQMAQVSGFHRNQLSQYINQELGKSFKDWINHYRLEYFKDRMMEEPNSSILDLAYESGFKSKSTYNDLFRKKYDMTPREYRRKGRKM